MRGEVLTVMNADDTEKFTATADLLDGSKARFCLLLSQPTKVSAARTGQTDFERAPRSGEKVPSAD